MAHDDACFAEARVERIKKAAAYIAERRIMEAAVPIAENTLKKYAGKAAGPKTTEKLCSEIADAIGNGASVYLSSPVYNWKPNRICISFSSAPLCFLKAEVYAERWESFVDDNNKFTTPTLKAVDNSDLPEDLEAWADEFERAEKALEEAKATFEATASNLRRVNLGNACLENYRITRN